MSNLPGVKDDRYVKENRHTAKLATALNKQVRENRNGLLFPETSENPWITQNGARDVRPGPRGLTTLELCAGAGGQAIGLEQAGIDHACLVELDPHACATLRLNRPSWTVRETDLNKFDGSAYEGVDLISGGLPCPPFSIAGKQLGTNDERNLFPAMIRLVDRVRPKAVMIENVRGIMEAAFEDYRFYISNQLKKLGYQTGWKLMQASDFGVPQLRPRVVFVALRSQYAEHFAWPKASQTFPLTVGEALYDLMSSRGWEGAQAWKKMADEIAPTIVGGSHKHGGPDLGPTRARRAWGKLGVDGLGIANEPPDALFVGMPKLTIRMVARLQGFPDDWEFAGRKTASYRQVGNAFPPPFAKAVAECVKASLNRRRVVR